MEWKGIEMVKKKWKERERIKYKDKNQEWKEKKIFFFGMVGVGWQASKKKESKTHCSRSHTNMKAMKMNPWFFTLFYWY